MIHGRSTFGNLEWTLESTDFLNGYKIVKYADDGSILEETDYPDKAAAQAAWETFNDQLCDPNFTP